MRLIGIFSLLLALCACATEPESIACPEVRKQVCTMEYNPTCVVQKDGSFKEYSSPCNACAHDVVDAYQMGPCPE